jgi:MoxR-like ATPase
MLKYNGTRPDDVPDTWAAQEREHPAQYSPELGLVHAIEVALTLDKPLLLTGEPGTGKTQLAYHLAWALGLGAPLKFEATSVMQTRDMFYSFDSLGRFHAAQEASGSTSPADFITFQALGQALMRSLDTLDHLPPMFHAHLSDEAPGAPSVTASDPFGDSRGDPCGDPGAIGERSVVLVDEIDKAPRDVPNDVLNQIEHMYFRVPECAGLEVRGNPERRPVLIFTSNSERFLPDAFLRRCIFYDIPYPTSPQLEAIVHQRLNLASSSVPRLVRECISLINYLRSPEAGLARRPGPAELLDLLKVLVLQGHDLERPLAHADEIIVAAACTLVKNRDDQPLVETLIANWRQQMGEVLGKTMDAGRC